MKESPDKEGRARPRGLPCRAALLVLAFGGVLFGLGRAGQPDAAQTPTIRVASRLILMDVRVQDRDGRPVTGLTVDDFTLSEDGVPQAVTYFREVALPLEQCDKPAPAMAPASPPGDSAGKGVQTAPDRGLPAAAKVTALERRVLILLFNQAAAGLQESASMKEAARRFLARQFTDRDAAAVLVFNNGLRMLCGLTGDRAALERALARLDAVNPELEASLPGGETGSLDADGYLADETEYALFDANQQLSAIQSVAEAFGDVAGRKALIYFSAGLVLQGVENEQELRLTTDRCNRSNLSIYAVDARGLVALSPGGGAQREGGGGTSLFDGRSSLNRLAGLNQTQESLRTLSEETGGEALVDDNDLGKVFARAREDASHYYLLGYPVEEGSPDGRFHKVEVRVRFGNYRISARRGYSAGRPYLAMSGAEREVRLFKEVLEDRHPSDFPLSLAAEYAPQREGGYAVPLLLDFDPASVNEPAGAGSVEVEIVLLARDLQGRTAGGVRDQVAIRPGPNTREARFVYQNTLVLAPGRYRLSAFVRDNRTGRLARADCGLELPPDQAVRCGSLVLAATWQAPDAGAGAAVRKGRMAAEVPNPLKVQGKVLIPRADGSFRPTETLYVHTRVLPGEASPEGLRFRLLLDDSAGKRLYASEPKAPQFGEDKVGSVNARLPLDQLGPGTYRLRLEITGPGLTPQTLEKGFTVRGPGNP